MEKEREVTEIDGSVLEGGGQMIRVACTMANVLKQPVNINKIRAKRSKPGLGAQHAAGVRVVSRLSNMTVIGCSVGSTSLIFQSSHESHGSHGSNTVSQRKSTSLVDSNVISEDCGTAGAISLIIQVALPVALFSSGVTPWTLNLVGGTNVLASPPIDHTLHVLFPILRNMGTNIDLEIHRRGFYPVGGGSVAIHIPKLTQPLQPLIMMEQGRIVSIHGIIAGNIEMDLLMDMKSKLKKEMRCRLVSLIDNVGDIIEDIIVDTNTRYETTSHHHHHHHHGDSRDSGKRRRDSKSSKGKQSVSIQIYAKTTTGCILSANSLSDNGDTDVERVVQDLFELIASGAAVDEHTADQLLVYMAFASDVSQIVISPPSRLSSLHIESVFHVISTVLKNDTIFTLEQLSNGCRLIICRGMGYLP